MKLDELKKEKEVKNELNEAKIKKMEEDLKNKSQQEHGLLLKTSSRRKS